MKTRDAATIICIGLFGVGCGDSAEYSAVRYLQALAQRDYEAAYELDFETYRGPVYLRGDFSSEPLQDKDLARQRQRYKERRQNLKARRPYEVFLAANPIIEIDSEFRMRDVDKSDERRMRESLAYISERDAESIRLTTVFVELSFKDPLGSPVHDGGAIKRILLRVMVDEEASLIVHTESLLGTAELWSSLPVRVVSIFYGGSSEDGHFSRVSVVGGESPYQGAVMCGVDGGLSETKSSKDEFGWLPFGAHLIDLPMPPPPLDCLVTVRDSGGATDSVEFQLRGSDIAKFSARGLCWYGREPWLSHGWQNIFLASAVEGRVFPLLETGRKVRLGV